MADFSLSIVFIQIPIGFPTKNEQFFEIGGTKWLFEIELESVQEDRRCNKLSLNMYLDNLSTFQITRHCLKNPSQLTEWEQTFSFLIFLLK